MSQENELATANFITLISFMLILCGVGVTSLFLMFPSKFKRKKTK